MMICRGLPLVALLVCLGARPALAEPDSASDRVSIGNDITVADGTTSGDLVCVFCNIQVHGEVGGDVVAVLGGVTVDPQRSIAGEVVTVGGSAALGQNAVVQGDLVAVAGDFDSEPGAQVHGSQEVFPGRGWLLLPFAPLVVFVGLIWLVVWFARRNRYRFPVYPHGRGF